VAWHEGGMKARNGPLNRLPDCLPSFTLHARCPSHGGLRQALNVVAVGLDVHDGDTRDLQQGVVIVGG
jgi:hypothetical protein